MTQMSESRLREQLSLLDISERAIDIYIAVLKQGETTAGELSDSTGVSQSYVYDLCSDLAANDLIRIDDTVAPTKIIARSPEDVIESLSSRLNTLDTAIADLYQEPEPSSSQFEIVKSKQTVINRIRERIRDADHEVFLVVPHSVYDRFTDVLTAARQRGVLVLLLLTDENETTLDESQLASTASVVRSWRADPPVLAVTDGDSGVMGEPGIVSSRHGDRQAVVFSQSQVGIGFFGAFISNYWPMGTEVFITGPDSLPETYSYFRNGVFNATLYWNDAIELEASVKVVNRESGMTKQFERLPIEEIRQSIIEPRTSTFPMENSIVLVDDGEPITVGGQDGIGAFYEDYEGTELTLYARE